MHNLLPRLLMPLPAVFFTLIDRQIFNDPKLPAEERNTHIPSLGFELSPANRSLEF